MKWADAPTTVMPEAGPEMDNHSSLTNEATLTREEHPPLGGDSTQEVLHERVRRLEDAVAALQDTRSLEERVLNRVTENVRPRVEASFQRLDGTRRPAPAPSPAPLPLPPLPQVQAVTPSALRSGWTLFELAGELRTFVRMFFDMRYRVTWYTWLVTVIGLSFVLLSHWVVPFAYLPVVGPVLDKAVDLFLILFIYKVLTLEAQRYREALTAYQQAYPN
jgi:hypothetical protein